MDNHTLSSVVGAFIIGTSFGICLMGAVIEYKQRRNRIGFKPDSEEEPPAQNDGIMDEVMNDDTKNAYRPALSSTYVTELAPGLVEITNLNGGIMHFDNELNETE